MPDDYTVQSITSSPDCAVEGDNPLTNAVVITRSESGASSQSASRETSSDDDNYSRREISVRVSHGSSRDESAPKSPLEQRAAKLNNEAKLENAATRGDIMAGMTTAQVLKAWGLPRENDNTTRHGSPPQSRWVYRRNGESVTLYFENGILVDWRWDH